MLKKCGLFFIGFVLMLIVLMFGVCFVYIVSIDNMDSVIDKMNCTDYFSLTANNINNEIFKYVEQSGLPEKIFDKLVTSDMVFNSVNLYLKNIYGNTGNYVVDTSNFDTKFDSVVNAYIESEDIFLDSDNQASLLKFKGLVTKIYGNRCIPNVGASMISKLLFFVHNYVYIFAIACFVIIMLLICFLKRSIFLEIGLISSGTFGIILLNILKNLNIVTDFYFGSVAFSNFIKEYILNVFNIMFLFSFIILVIGVITFFVIFKRDIANFQKN